jgi:PIN domain nuclease of toxin-antitoxin system
LISQALNGNLTLATIDQAVMSYNVPYLK